MRLEYKVGMYYLSQTARRAKPLRYVVMRLYPYNLYEGVVLN